MHTCGIQRGFDWTEYLKLAKKLAGQTNISPSKEAMLRSSVSRAYYAVFCKTRNYLRYIEMDNSIPQGGKVHQYVINKFINSKDNQRREIGINLDRLRVDRNRVDYDDSVKNLSSMADMDLKIAQKILSILETLQKKKYSCHCFT